MTWDTTYDGRFEGHNSILPNTKEKLTSRSRTLTLADELIACGEYEFLNQEKQIEVSATLPLFGSKDCNWVKVCPKLQ